MHEPRDKSESSPGRSDVVAAVRAFWTIAAPPPLDAILTPAILADERLLADVIATDIEERRIRSLPCGMDIYISAFPMVLTMPSVRRVLLTGEFISHAGENIESIRANLLRTHPQFAGDISAVASISLLLSGDEPSIPRHSPGDLLGKYRLDSHLGAGSFAHTWLAWDTSLRRHVALKILDSANLHETEAGERVLAEARAAAGLDHESIVRIHEAGRFPHTGECYIDAQFVGDLVFGSGPNGEGAVATTRTLSDLMAKGPIAPMHATTLIGAIARAVAISHARGITHRDIKPSNILLNAAGAPLLADFGLAQQEEPAAPQAASGAAASAPRPRIAGTPAFIAPEIARGERGTPLSDIFSLGCTLRSLLTGRLPRQPSGDGNNRSTFAQMLIDARSQPLPPIATVVPGLPPTLCKICDRATAHSPSARYASADALAADLRAFVEHRPTEADPQGASGTARLWIRRHSTIALFGAASVILISVATLGFIIRLSIERNRAIEAEHVAQIQRDEAVAANNTIQLMNRFVARTFSSTRGQKSTADFTVQDAIQLGVSRAENSFADRPLVAAAVSHFLGEAAIGAGDLDIAQAQLERALALRRLHLGDSHTDTIATLRQWGELMHLRRKYSDAQESFSQVLKTLGADEAYRNADGLRAHIYLCERTMDTGDLKTIGETLERVAQVYRSQPLDGSVDFARALNALIRLYEKQQLHEQSERIQREIVSLNLRNFGPDDISTLNSIQGLGGILRFGGKLAEAEAVYREVLPRYRATLGDSHVGTLHVSLEIAGLALPDRWEEAMQLITDVRTRTAGYSKPNIYRVRSIILYAAALDAAGRDLKETEQAMKDAAVYCNDAMGPDNKWAREAVNQYAKFLERQGRSAEAKEVRENGGKPSAK